MPVDDRISLDDGGAPAIDPDSPIPLYFQLKTFLLQQILSGRYAAGDRLPTEHEICERLGASRTPVHRALAELAEEGVIIRRPRLGTFVNPHWVHRHPNGPELRALVPEGPWEQQMRESAEDGLRVSAASVSLPDLHRALASAVAEGRGPDLALIDSVWVPEFAAAGFLRPLDELDRDWVAREYETDFLEPFVTANRHGGHPVAVQAEADVAGIWYRRGALEDAGAAVPGTWAELRSAGLAVRDSPGLRSAAPLVMPAGSRAGETATYCLLALLAANGASVLADGTVTVDTPATEETLAFLRRLIDDGIMPAEAVAFEWDRPIRMLAHGQAAMAFGGSYDARLLAEETGSSLADLWEEFGFAVVPAGPGGSGSTLAGGMVWVIPRQAARPEHAIRVLTRLVAPEACAQMSRLTAQIPPRHSAVALVAPESRFLSETAAMLASAAVRPATAAYARVSAQLQSMLESVLTDRLAPRAAAARGAELIVAITGLPRAGAG